VVAEPPGPEGQCGAVTQAFDQQFFGTLGARDTRLCWSATERKFVEALLQPADSAL